jgi:hypothetical protein
MDIQVIHDKVDGIGFGVAGDDRFHGLSELRSGTVRGSYSEVYSGFRFYGAVDIGRPTALRCGNRVIWLRWSVMNLP